MFPHRTQVKLKRGQIVIPQITLNAYSSNFVVASGVLSREELQYLIKYIEGEKKIVICENRTWIKTFSDILRYSVLVGAQHYVQVGKQRFFEAAHSVSHFI